MQNKETNRTIRNRTKRNNATKQRGVIQTHIINNFKNYVIITIVFLVRSNTWSTIYK